MGNNQLAVTGTEQSMPPYRGSRDAKAIFAKHVGPALALVAPTGMSETERKTWLGAAYTALGHLSEPTLAYACRAAMGKVDHPAKLVPAILTEAETNSYQPSGSIEAIAYDGPPTEPPLLEKPRAELTEEQTARANAFLRTIGLDHMTTTD